MKHNHQHFLQLQGIVIELQNIFSHYIITLFRSYNCFYSFNQLENSEFSNSKINNKRQNLESFLQLYIIILYSDYYTWNRANVSQLKCLHSRATYSLCL